MEEFDKLPIQAGAADVIKEKRGALGNLR